MEERSIRFVGNGTVGDLMACPIVLDENRAKSDEIVFDSGIFYGGSQEVIDMLKGLIEKRSRQ